jgi:hypothetical protein
VHRSAIEFFQQSKTSTVMDKQLHGFDVVEAISQIHLAEMRPWPPYLIDPYTWTRVYTDVIRMRTKVNLDQEPYDFLESLESTINMKLPESIRDPYKYYNGYIADVAVEDGCMCIIGPFKVPTRVSHIGLLIHPLHIAARFGAVVYVQWKLSSKPELTRDLLFTTALLHCLQQDHEHNLLPGKIEAFHSMLT